MAAKKIIAGLKIQTSISGRVYNVQEAYDFAKDQFNSLAKKNLRVPVISVRL